MQAYLDNSIINNIFEQDHFVFIFSALYNASNTVTWCQCVTYSPMLIGLRNLDR